MGWFEHRMALLVLRGATPEQLAELEARITCVALAADHLVELALEAAGAGSTPTAPTEVQVFIEGQWLEYPKEGGLTLTRQHFEQILANHEKYGTDPVIDREHESVRGWEVTLAQGWCKSFRIGTDKRDPSKTALFATVEWTAAGKANVEGKYFRYVSGGVFLNAKDRATSEPVGARMDHIAICCKPFIDNMQPLTNSAIGGAGRQQPNHGGSMNKDLQKVLCGLLGLGEGADEATILKGLNESTQGVRLSFAAHGKIGSLFGATTLGLLKLDGNATAAQIEGRIAELAAREGQLVQLSGRLQKLEDDKVVAEVNDAIAKFKYAPAELEVQLELARSNPELWRKVTALRAASNPGGAPVVLGSVPRGEGAGAGGAEGAPTAIEQKKLDAVDAYLKANPNANYGDAVVACARANPALFSQKEV